jgi:hypothetical protein
MTDYEVIRPWRIIAVEWISKFTESSALPVWILFEYRINPNKHSHSNEHSPYLKSCQNTYKNPEIFPEKKHPKKQWKV